MTTGWRELEGGGGDWDPTEGAVPSSSPSGKPRNALHRCTRPQPAFSSHLACSSACGPNPFHVCSILCSSSFQSSTQATTPCFIHAYVLHSFLVCTFCIHNTYAFLHTLAHLTDPQPATSSQPYRLYGQLQISVSCGHIIHTHCPI